MKGELHSLEQNFVRLSAESRSSERQGQLSKFEVLLKTESSLDPDALRSMVQLRTSRCKVVVSSFSLRWSNFLEDWVRFMIKDVKEANPISFHACGLDSRGSVKLSAMFRLHLGN